jgi:hypothetical protein
MPFGLSTLAVKAIGIGLLVLALLAGFAWFVHSEREVGAQQVRTEVAAATAAQKAVDDAESQRRIAEQQGIVHDAQLQASAANAAAARAAAAGTAYRLQLASFVAANRRPTDPASAAGSTPAGDPIGVLAEVLGATDDFAGRVAAEADANRIAGLACERAYQSLTGGAP